jgi:hypothetical protein
VNPDAECSYTYASLNFSYDHFLDLNALAPSSSLPPSPSSYLILIFCSLLPTTASIVYLPFIPPISCIFADLIFLKCNVSRIHYRFSCTALQASHTLYSVGHQRFCERVIIIHEGCKQSHALQPRVRKGNYYRCTRTTPQ